MAKDSYKKIDKGSRYFVMKENDKLKHAIGK